MQTKRVFIIEDFVEDYLRLAAVLDRYDIDYYPSIDERHMYSDLFADWAGSKSSADFEEIKAAIAEANPDFIFLDIGLKGNESVEDRSGLELKEALLDVFFPNIPVFTITARYTERHSSIWKASPSELQAEVFLKFIALHGIKERQVSPLDQEVEDEVMANGQAAYHQEHSTSFQGADNHNFASGYVDEKEGQSGVSGNTVVIDSAIPKNGGLAGTTGKGGMRTRKGRGTGPADTKDIQKLLQRYSDPNWLVNCKARLNFKAEPSIRFLAHVAISYMFYILIAFLAILAPVKIVMAVMHSNDILVVAETVFVAFLPLLVVFGFFVFYWQSLRPYLNGSLVDDMDFEKTSELLTLTKKLFVSSLISLLFTKVVEFLFFAEEEHQEAVKGFRELYGFEHPMSHLITIAVLLVVLTVYYVFLSQHKGKGGHEKG